MGGKRRANRLSGAVMARRQTRSADWGFPRWRGYGTERETVKVRLCDRHGCTLPGDCPAPKAPNSPERWWFCPDHAGEYNRHWDYFAGLSAEEAAARAAEEERDNSGFQQSKHYGWGGPGDGSRLRLWALAATMILKRCAPPGASLPRKITPMFGPAIQRRQTGFRKFRRPMMCSRQRKTVGSRFKGLRPDYRARAACRKWPWPKPPPLQS